VRFMIARTIRIRSPFACRRAACARRATPTARRASAPEREAETVTKEPPELAVFAPVTAASSLLMVMWVALPFPGSAWVGMTWHHEIVFAAMESLRIAPASLILKYEALQSTIVPAPGLVHAVPAAVWSGLAPFQLLSRGEGAHKAAGRTMLTMSGVMMAGFAAIDASGLTAQEHDFQGFGGPLADAVDAWLPSWLASFNQGGMYTIAAWFLWAGLQCGLSARAGDVRAHRAWAIRHIGAGLWVALQRPLFAALREVQYLTLPSGEAATAEAMADAFYVAAVAATALYVGAAEIIAREGTAAAEGAEDELV